MANRNKDLNTRRDRNENKIKYFEEICIIEKMLKENKTIKEIYEYMKDLVKYTFEDELKYVHITKIIERTFENGNQNKIDQTLVPQYIDLTIKQSYKRELNYQQAFCQIYGILVSIFDQDKINKKMDENYKYTRNYINF